MNVRTCSGCSITSTCCRTLLPRTTVKKGDAVYAVVKPLSGPGYRMIPGVVLGMRGDEPEQVQYPATAIDPNHDDRNGKGYWSPGSGGEPWLWRATQAEAMAALRDYIIAKHTAAAKRECEQLARAVDAGPLPAGFVKPPVYQPVFGG